MRRLYLAICVVSVAIIVFELNLLQVLALVQWHYFASLVIAIALLGFGASGTCIALARNHLLHRFETVVPLFMALAGLSMAVAVPATQIPGLRFDSYLAFVDPRQTVALVLTCLVLFVPFFLAATAIGLTFVKHTSESGTIYFWNLLGSGLGGIFAVGAMWFVEPASLAPFAGVIASLAALLLVSEAKPGWPRWVLFLTPVVCLVLVLRVDDVSLSQFKDLKRTLDLPGSKIVEKRASPEGLMHVVSAPMLRGAPGLSLTFDGEIPVQPAAFSNGDLQGFILPWSRTDTAHLYDFTTRALPYEMGATDRVLIIDAGTSTSVSFAVSRGARVVAAESDRSMHRLLGGSLLGPTDSLFLHPNVVFTTLAPRNALATDTTRYDLIVFPDVGSFGGTVGLQEMSEHYALTAASFRTAWDRLTPTGRIAITCWLDYPYRNPLRTLSTLIAALDGHAEDAPLLVTAVRSWADITFVLSRQRTTAEQSAAVRGFATRLSFDPLLLPDLGSDEQQHFNAVGDTALFAHLDSILAPRRDQFTAGYDFRIDAPTDDRPYFYRSLRLSHLGRLTRGFGSASTPFFGLGLLVAMLSWIVTSVLAGLLILLPLAGKRIGGQTRLRTLFYFAAIGVGFMFVEIALIQRLTLLLGHPVYAASLVISTLLIASGIGSLVSSRFGVQRSSARRATLATLLLVAVSAFLLPQLLHEALGFSSWARVVLAVLIVTPLGFVMGMPFPLGLRLVGSRSPSQVPWAWGVNGCLSVVAASSAALITVQLGLQTTLLLAALAYGCASVSVGPASRSERKPDQYH